MPLKITLHPAGRLVTVEYLGHISAADMLAHAGETDALDTKIQPGFTVLTDLTGLERIDPECAAIIGRVMEKFTHLGAKRVVRIIPDPKKDIGLGILTHFHYRRGISVNTVQTHAEAELLLD